MAERASKVRVGEVVTVRYGARRFKAKVVEDRGPIGVRGRQLVRVRDLESESGDDTTEYELPAEELEVAPSSSRGRKAAKIVRAAPYPGKARGINHAIKPERAMAKNGKVSDGHREGAVKDRSQAHNPKTDQWVKRDADTGRFIDVKQDGKPFKGVRREK